MPVKGSILPLAVLYKAAAVAVKFRTILKQAGELPAANRINQR
jgi:hypothetical protein